MGLFPERDKHVLHVLRKAKDAEANIRSTVHCGQCSYALSVQYNLVRFVSQLLFFTLPVMNVTSEESCVTEVWLRCKTRSFPPISPTQAPSASIGTERESWTAPRRVRPRKAALPSLPSAVQR